MTANQSLLELHALAAQARTRSHSPYSKHKVGAAIKLKSGQCFAGCNVENASYGGTVCAERVAIWKAVSELGTIEISDIVVVTDQATGWPPCGFCRQVLAEFSTPETRVHIGNLAEIQKTISLQNLFPEAFYPSHLLKPEPPTT